MRFGVFAALCLAMVAAAGAVTAALPVATQLPARCHGTYNTIPVVTVAPTLSKTVTNGKRYVAGAGNDTFAVVHLWGTPYQMGYAQGQLLKQEISALESDFTSYIESLLEQNLKKVLPQWLIDLIAEYGAPFLLDLTYDTTKPFTPASYIDEMQGVADGANVSVKFIRRLNMFPELTKAACTIVGANGPATPTGTINHLRGLDFDPTVPFKDYAQVTVYHGTGKGNQIANFGWAGMIGALTGISDRTIGIGEKVWDNHPKGVMGTAGQPWMSILRDVLYTDNITQALATIQNAHRTCAIHVGVGDSTTNTFRGVRMAEKYFAVFNDTSINYQPGHPALKGIVYWDKHAQPSHDPCLSDLLQEFYGNITAETLALGVSAMSRTGDLHSVAFDYENIVAFVANARKTTVSSGSLDAYNRQFTRLDVKALFAEKP